MLQVGHAAADVCGLAALEDLSRSFLLHARTNDLVGGNDLGHIIRVLAHKLVGNLRSHFDGSAYKLVNLISTQEPLELPDALRQIECVYRWTAASNCGLMTTP